MMWFIKSVAIINATHQLLDIYIYIYIQTLISFTILNRATVNTLAILVMELCKSKLLVIIVTRKKCSFGNCRFWSWLIWSWKKPSTLCLCKYTFLVEMTALLAFATALIINPPKMLLMNYRSCIENLKHAIYF